MKRSRALFVLLLVSTSACATMNGDSPRRTRAAAPATRAGSTPIEASLVSAAQETTPLRERVLSDTELAIWNDPGFQRRFAESYMAETDVEPSVTLVERDQMQEILDLMAADELDEAIDLIEEEGGEDASAVFDFTLANIRFQREELDLAAAAYRVAVDKHPKFRRAWGNMGLIHVRQGDFEEAVEAFTRALELGEGKGVTYGLLGFAYSNLEEHIAAETAYRMAVLLDPETMDWKMGLARSFFKQERYADAVAICNSLIADRPEKAELWLLQGNAYIGLNQPLEAAKNLDVVDRLGKATPDSLDNLADIYVNEGLYDLAVGHYLRAMEMKPGGGVGRAMRAANVLIAQGALAETRFLAEGIEAVYGDQLETDARKDVLRLRARLALAEGAGDEEARVLEEIVELDPLDGDALLLLGQHSHRTGEHEKAILYYERAARLESYEADAKVGHAQLLVEEGRYTEALPLLRRAQVLKPRDHVQDYLEQVERIAKARS